MMTGDAPLAVDLALFFIDPDGDALTADAVSSNPAVATAEVSGSILTITALTAGTTTISVTVTDPGGLSVTGRVELIVSISIADVPETLSIKMEDGTATVTLPDGHTLNSTDPEIVTVMADSAAEANVWVVTAVAAGDADVEVLDASATVAKTIAVTVSPAPISIPTTIELQKSGEDAEPSEEFELPSGHTLQTADSSKVNVVRTGATGEGNQWRITARGKTAPKSVDVFVNDANNDYVQKIAVTVLNSLPVRTTTLPSRSLLGLEMVNIMDAGEQGPTSYDDGALYDPMIESRVLYKTGFGDLGRFYTDADGDPLSFAIEVAAPHTGLILFKLNDEERLHTAGAAGPAGHVSYADILTERVDRPIGVNIYAHDGDDRSEKAVPFELRNEKPIPRNDGHGETPITGNQAYLLTQLQEPGFFRNERYGNRTGVDHIFKFGHSTKLEGGARVLGFTFAHDFLEDLVRDGFSIGDNDDNADNEFVLDADDHLYGVSGTDFASATTVDTDLTDGDSRTLVLGRYVPEELGSIFYDVEIDGPITQSGDDEATIANFVRGNVESGIVAALDPDSAYPEIKFRFNSVRTGTLTITFGVWADADGDGPKTADWETESRRIDFTIIGCTSVETIADCP